MTDETSSPRAELDEPCIECGRSIASHCQSCRECYPFGGAEAHERSAGAASLDALRNLVDAVNALEARAIRSSGEFHVWAEERMVTEARDEAAAILRSAGAAPIDEAIHRICNVLDNDEGGAELYEAALNLYRARLASEGGGRP